MSDKALTWTPERTADLKHRCEKLGETSTMIANAMGVTRNTVVGKMDRMGLKRADVPIPKRATKPKRVQVTRTWTKTQKRDRKAPGVRGLKRRAGEPKPLGERPGGCQWMHGDSTDRKFCGHERQEKSPYCAHHHDRCYVPAPKKKRRGEVIEP